MLLRRDFENSLNISPFRHTVDFMPRDGSDLKIVRMNFRHSK